MWQKQTCIVSLCAFDLRLFVYWSTDPDGLWNDPAEVESRLIDVSGTAAGWPEDDHFFEVEVSYPCHKLS